MLVAAVMPAPVEADLPLPANNPAPLDTSPGQRPRQVSADLRSATLAEDSDLDSYSDGSSDSCPSPDPSSSLGDSSRNGSYVPSTSQAAYDGQHQQQQPSSREPDPDYEVPEGALPVPAYCVPAGRLTETQVVLAHSDGLHIDRYGFIVSPEEAQLRAARARRTRSQIRADQRVVSKWRKMLGGGRADWQRYVAAKPAKVKRRVRKGIPDEFRGLVWQYLSGGRDLMARHPGRYAQLLTIANDTVDMEIMRDLNRTFPNHVFFHQRQGPGQQSLFHVLRAFSSHDNLVGYVQGMGFVTAILLMYMSEEEAFWALVALMKGEAGPPLEGMYQAGMPLLQCCLFQFQQLLKQELPRLGAHLEKEGVEPPMYCTHWFNTIFAYSLPFEHLLRVWDVFLLEGMKTVFRVGLALLASGQDHLLAQPFEQLVEALNGRKWVFPALNRPPTSLMRSALRISVSKRLEILREQYEQQGSNGVS